MSVAAVSSVRRTVWDSVEILILSSSFNSARLCAQCAADTPVLRAHEKNKTHPNKTIFIFYCQAHLNSAIILL